METDDYDTIKECKTFALNPAYLTSVICIKSCVSHYLEIGADWGPAFVADLAEMISIQEKEKDLSNSRTFFIGELDYENLEPLGYTQGKADMQTIVA